MGDRDDRVSEWPELGLEDFTRQAACPSCGRADASPLDRRAGNIVSGRRFLAEAYRFGDALRRARRLMACGRCGLVFQEWVPTRELLLRLYGAGGDRKPWPADPRRLTWRRALARLPRTPGRLLDVGANDGHFLAQLPAGWKGASLEPASGARGSLRQVTAEIYEGFLDDDVIPGLAADSFDVVCLFDVAEHFRDVNKAVANLYRCLKPGGCAIVETGDRACLPARLLGSLWWYYDFIEHFVFFTRESLGAALSSGNLGLAECRRVVHTDMGGAPRMLADLASKMARARRWAGADRDAERPGGAFLIHPLRVYWPDHLFAVARKAPTP